VNYFKAFGLVTASQAIAFSVDLKLAHYLKVRSTLERGERQLTLQIPPRVTFAGQVIATLISTFVSIGVQNFLMHRIAGLCTPHAPNSNTCPGISSFWTASVMWGTLTPQRVFGPGGLYTPLLLGFPLGTTVALATWAAQRRWHRVRWLRQLHPIPLLLGGEGWAPYNLSFVIPAIPVAWASWIWIKRRYVAFWSRYNYALAAAFSAGIAFAGIIIFFALEYTGTKLVWWGNTVVSEGCEGTPCTLYQVEKNGHFGPGIGDFA
jgi:OPT family oligopeptide transporter